MAAAAVAAAAAGTAAAPAVRALAAAPSAQPQPRTESQTQRWMGRGESCAGRQLRMRTVGRSHTRCNTSSGRSGSNGSSGGRGCSSSSIVGRSEPANLSVGKAAAPVRSASVVALAASSASGGLGSRLPAQFRELVGQEDLDQVLADAAQAGDLVLIEWMALWCRKCIYLKPKLEKLVNEFPSVKFCVVDVNKVPFAFVKGANISKMPTIQLWSDKEMVEEVIGGEAAWQVLDKIRDIIKRHR